MRDRTFYICLAVIGLMFAYGVDTVTAASLHEVRAARTFKEQQLHRDRGTVRFMVNHPWSRHRPGFMRLEKQAEHRIVVEHGSIRTLEAWERQLLQPVVDVAAWQATVDCENSGRWEDSPGEYMYGLQFDPGSWRTAASHTGRWDGSKVSQVINATWLAKHSAHDPWPNCWDPFFG